MGSRRAIYNDIAPKPRFFFSSEVTKFPRKRHRFSGFLLFILLKRKKADSPKCSKQCLPSDSLMGILLRYNQPKVLCIMWSFD